MTNVPLPSPPARYWQSSFADIWSALSAVPEGLSDDEARRRLEVIGPNVLRPHGERAVLLQFLSHFRNPLVLVLLAASVVSAFLGDVRNFAVITLIVLMSVILDFVQEFRAGRAAERLRNSVALRAMVVRDGQAREVPVRDVVPGDVVLLAAGDLVPADGRIVQSRDFFVNQALLTGESYPVEKHATDADPSADLATAVNIALMGASVVSGSAHLLVVNTGRTTELGGIADTLVTRHESTAFERGTQAFGVLIMRLTILLVLFVLLVNASLHRPLFDSFLFAVALAVGLTPELLPMVISVTLSRGALRLTRHRVIIKRLSAVQDLGAIDVLCTDKTGTLTEGQIRLERHVDPAGSESERVLELAYLNSYFETGVRSPLDDAILRHKHIDVRDWRKVDEVPFDFERRRVSVLVERDHRRILVVKGAPEDVLSQCAKYEAGEPGKLADLEDAARSRISELYDLLSCEGFRLLGIAWRDVSPDHSHAGLADESALVFAGFAGFLDPPKESAADALAALATSGVTLKVVTGDNEGVTRHVCAQLRLPVTGVLTGSELQGLDQHALLARVETVNLFCRVNPAQKSRILLALRGRGHVVGFLGDGINDAPSLHAADVGISVDSAVDVAKEAADLILLDHDLRVLHGGVREGRRTFGNVMKYVMMGTSSNFGNMFSMAGATLVLPFLPMLPIQILLNNFLYDLSELAIPFDNVEEDTLARPHTWNMNVIYRSMLVFGPISSLFDFLTFFVLLRGFHASDALFRTGWFIESVASQVLVIFIIRTRESPFVNRPHKGLVALAVSVAAVAAILPLTPAAEYFGFARPPLQVYLVLAAIVLAYLASVQVAKRAFHSFWQ